MEARKHVERVQFIIYLVLGVPLVALTVYLTRGAVLALLFPVLAYLAYLLVRAAVARARSRREM